MKKIFKVATAGLLAASVATTGLIMQTTPAEALGLGSIGKSATKSLGVGGDVDIEGLNHTQSNMIQHLNYSVLLLNAAFSNISNAADTTKANSNLITKESVLKSAVSSDTNNALQMEKAAEQNKAEATTIKTQLASAMSANDSATLERIDSAVKEGNTERLLSDTLAGYAAGEATKILKATMTAMKNPGKNADQIQQLVKTAQQTQSLLKTRNALSKALSEATSDYKKNRGIKDISKKEQTDALGSLSKG